MEIGIGSNTGILRRITLTSVHRACLGNITNNVTKIEAGTPVFGVDIIPKKGIYDYNNDFDVFLGEHTISTIITRIDNCEKIIRLDRLDIGFDNQNDITHIALNNLSVDEHKELKGALKL
jgi:hypothetical protein